MNTQTSASPLPKAEFAADKIPGHWLLARMGERVLRPSGLEMTRAMLRELAIGSADAVVAFAPGLGVTTRLVLESEPRSYAAIERDEAAACCVRQFLIAQGRDCLAGSATETRLPVQSAAVVFGEAMLTMQGPEQKRAIMREAAWILKPGGSYEIHELCLVPDDMEEGEKREIQRALNKSIRVGARPRTAEEWRSLLEEEGFQIRASVFRPMRLLEPGQILEDEGLRGALRLVFNFCHDAEARRRVLSMRRVFHQYYRRLAAIMIVGRKPTDSD